jgi:hypothetical protein
VASALAQFILNEAGASAPVAIEEVIALLEHSLDGDEE